MLLSLRGMFLALGMVILAVGVGGSAMRLRWGFVMFRSLVVFVFHGCFLIASRRMSAPEHMVPLRSIHNPAMVVEQIKVVKGTPSCFRCYGTFRLNVHTSTAARYKAVCAKLLT